MCAVVSDREQTLLRLGARDPGFPNRPLQFCQEIGSAADMDLVPTDHPLPVPVAADLERVSPLRWPGDQYVVVLVAGVDDAGSQTV